MTTIETNKEKWFEVEVNRLAGEIELEFPGRTQRKRKRISTALLRLRASSKPSPGNSVPQ